MLRDHVAGRQRLKAPTFIIYEVTNAVWQAERRARIASAQADAILAAVSSLGIELIRPAWGEGVSLARRFNRSAYDAAYLAVAERLGEQLITGDLHLYNAVHAALDWVVWVGEYMLDA